MMPMIVHIHPRLAALLAASLALLVSGVFLLA